METLEADGTGHPLKVVVILHGRKISVMVLKIAARIGQVYYVDMGIKALHMRFVLLGDFKAVRKLSACVQANACALI